MPDRACAECAAIQANIDSKKADLVRYELDLGSGADINRNFPLNDSHLRRHGFLSTSRIIHLYTNSMRQLINHSRFAGRHETATRPGHKAGSEV